MDKTIDRWTDPDGNGYAFKDTVARAQNREMINKISTETADRKAEVNTERKRIDNLIASGTAQTQEIGKKIIQDSSISSSGIVLKGLTNNNYYYKLFEESGSIDSEFCTITNQQGKYTAKLLKPGLYYMNFKVHVEMSGGFSEEVIAPLKLFKSNTLDWSTFDVLDAETVEVSKTENTSINKKIHFLFKITEPSYIRIYIDIDTSHTKKITFRIDGCDIIALDWKGKQSADLSELHDLRIGADGVVHNTAGEAVRKQIGNLTEDLEEITTKDYVNLLESSDVISIETVKGFPHPEYEPKKIKTINMSAVNNTVCELHVRLNVRANRKYLLSTLVSVKAGVGKVTVLFYDVETYSNIFNIYGDSVTYNGKPIGNSIDGKTTNIIGVVGTTKDGIVTARLRFESMDKTLIAEYSEMSLIDITDFSEDITKLNKYINMTYAERFDLKPKGVSLETKKELEKNLSESKIYTDTKITSLKQYSNYLYGKKWWAVGDSITFGARSDIDENGVRKTYATYIANRNEMVLKLDAISGRAMGVKENRTDSFCLDGYYNNCPFDYPDYITIFLGTNDTEEVGTIDSTDINTFSGGYNKVLDYLTATYPRAKIGIIPVYDLAEQRGQMTIALGEKWGVPVFNWDTHSFFYYHYQHNTVMERKQKEFMYFDGTRYEVHPIDAGYQFMSTMIESWMREL